MPKGVRKPPEPHGPPDLNGRPSRRGRKSKPPEAPGPAGAPEAPKKRGKTQRNPDGIVDTANLDTSEISLDRVEDTLKQIARVDHELKLAANRDLQGIARLMATRRGLVEDLHRELDKRQAANTSGDARQLEEQLGQAMAEMDDESLDRVLRDVQERKGIEIGAWLAERRAVDGR